MTPFEILALVFIMSKGIDTYETVRSLDSFVSHEQYRCATTADAITRSEDAGSHYHLVDCKVVFNK